MSSLARKYPHLFNAVTWEWGPIRASFSSLDQPPLAEKISNINLVAKVEDRWILLQHAIPTNPPGAEQITRVEIMDLDLAVSKLVSCGRHDLAELYQYANDLENQ